MTADMLTHVQLLPNASDNRRRTTKKRNQWSTEEHTSNRCPPPYRSYSSVQDEEDHQQWSSSDSSSYNSNPQRHHQAPSKLHQPMSKRRSSCGSPTSAASSTYDGTVNSLPHKTILSPHSLNGSAVYVNQANYNQMVSSSPIGAARRGQEASRQTSLASSGVVSTFLQLPKAARITSFPTSQYLPSNYPPLSSSNMPEHLCQLEETSSTTTKHNPPKRNRMEELRQCCKRPASRLCCLTVILLTIAALILTYVLTSGWIVPKHLKFSWLAPDILRQGQHTPNMLQMDVASEQIRFDLAGNMPFRGNYISVLDFKTNKVAIVDSSLRSGGRNLVCFVTDLDRQNIPDQVALQKAAKNSAGKTHSSLGGKSPGTIFPLLCPQTPLHSTIPTRGG
uniref:Uncharacterized protein n=1 Tax=Ditylenchus dipsaci TaxID=166011 RepID=A0A915CLU4_9BILA